MFASLLDPSLGYSRAPPVLCVSRASHPPQIRSIMARPPPSAADDEQLDRRLQQRLAKLQSHHSAIQLAMPPPSTEQLQARLQRLEAADSSHSHEADLRRRLDRLSGAGAGTGEGGGGDHSSLNSSSSSLPSQSGAALSLAVQSARPSERDPVEQLMEQTRARLQLDNGTTPSAAASSSSLLSASSADDSECASPPPASAAEVAQLLRQLSSLPDADLLPPVHGAGAEDDDSGSDAEVDEIVRQAMDEARDN